MVENLQKTDVKGRDISRPIDQMEFDGQMHDLAFDLNAFRIAEDVYELHYNRNLNFLHIVQHLINGKLSAIMAVLYGALCSGGLNIEWEEFSRKFRLIDVPGVEEKLMENIKKVLPEADEQAKDPR